MNWVVKLCIQNFSGWRESEVTTSCFPAISSLNSVF
ncbi:hypothetical protein ANCCAN_00471 [Ancylostoma caninum]|uniref:Uncharacterized protein n=1 Tax=Ancylostoma caninum TaxID=29170 RepID=A0A368HA41_ANCCA|nr:hypothetical protein ANCCAN_00471 [Ancylostoma caninum]